MSTDYKQLIDAVLNIDPTPGELSDFSEALNYPNGNPTVFTVKPAKNSNDNFIVSHPAFGEDFLLTPKSAKALRSTLETSIDGLDIDSYAAFLAAMEKKD